MIIFGPGFRGSRLVLLVGDVRLRSRGVGFFPLDLYVGPFTSTITCSIRYCDLAE